MKFFPKFKSSEIYLDYMASTPVAPQVMKVMRETAKYYANPFSAHSAGQKAANAIDSAIKRIAKHFQVPSSSLVPTSGATESNAIALQGVINFAIKNFDFVPHVVISAIEHPSVAGIKHYVDEGLITLDVLPVDNEGIIKIEELLGLLKKETILISVMLVNSEIGTVQPVQSISKVIRTWHKTSARNPLEEKFPIIHTDASQALLTRDLRVPKLHADLVTFNGHKIYASKSIGFLYINPRIKDKLEPLFLSNYEKSYIRPGTPEVSVIAGFATALDLVTKQRTKFIEQSTTLYDYFTKVLVAMGAEINGASVVSGNRVPTNVSVTFANCNHEYLQMQLDAKGIYCATRSACLERGQEGSEVLRAIATSNSESRNALRFSFGYETTMTQLQKVVAEIRKALTIQQSV